jgi:hypothetical protein
MTQPDPSASAAEPPALDPAAVQRALAHLRREQNFNAAASAGMVAALTGAVIWAAITVATQYQIGWMAVGVGFLVGVAVRHFGRGIEPRFGYLGAGLALVGCLAGNFLSLVGFVSREQHLGFFALLGDVNWAAVPGAMASAANPMDLLFYGLALYEGYKFSFRQVTPAELQSAAGS